MDGDNLKTNLSLALERAVTFVELAIALLLVMLAILGLGYLGLLLLSLFKTHIFLKPQEIHALLDTALVLFLVIELFRIALAYIADRRVLVTVIEAAFVAVARKVVLFDFKEYDGATGLFAALSLAVLLAGLAGVYLVIRSKDADN